jgi:NAD+ diphosphatase
VPVTGLGPLALSRGTVDRLTERRADRSWLEAAWDDPRSRVLVVDDGRARVRLGAADGDGSGGAELVLVPPAEAPDVPFGARYLLGEDAGGVVYFGMNGDLSREAAERDGYRLVSLRSVGALLGDRDAGLMTHAVALANWHTTHTHCPRCGAATDPEPGGHSARCPVDGTEHFPRTDPAVIMLVTDPDDRCLLGRNAAWPERRFSILAGFVDPGESAEQAVMREVHEETGIVVENVRYVGSQPWPMPRSLMLGYRAHAPAGQQIKTDDQELTEAIWFSRAELLAALEARELAIAPPVSIARRIIESWYGSELPTYIADWTVRS